jgi:hypothetical protein
MLNGKNARIQKTQVTGKWEFGSPKRTILELFSENLCQACHTTAPLSENIEACGLCQFSLAVVKTPKSLYIECGRKFAANCGEVGIRNKFTVAFAHAGSWTGVERSSGATQFSYRLPLPPCHRPRMRSPNCYGQVTAETRGRNLLSQCNTP